MSVYQDKDDRWRYRATLPDGTARRISGTAPKNNNSRQAALLAEAEHIARMVSQRSGSVEATTDPRGDHQGGNETRYMPGLAAPGRPAPPRAQTLGEFIPVYLKICEVQDAKSTFESKKGIVRDYIQSARINDRMLADLPLDQISSAVLVDVRNDWAVRLNSRIKTRVERLRPSTVNRVTKVLGHILSTAQNRDILERLPKIPRLKEAQPDPKFLSFEDAENILPHADGVWRVMILTALRAGLRRGELRALRWSDLDLANGYVNVRRSYVRGEFKGPKSGKGRSVPMASAGAGSMGLREALIEWRKTARHELVFCNEHGGPLPNGLMASALDRICRKAGLPEFGWHVFRHTFATHALQRGVNPRLVQKWLGHSSMAITERYSHVMPGYEHEAIALLDRPASRSLREPSLPRQSPGRPDNPDDAEGSVGAGIRSEFVRERRDSPKPAKKRQKSACVTTTN